VEWKYIRAQLVSRSQTLYRALRWERSVKSLATWDSLQWGVVYQ